MAAIETVRIKNKDIPGGVLINKSEFNEKIHQLHGTAASSTGTGTGTGKASRGGKASKGATAKTGKTAKGGKAAGDKPGSKPAE